MRGSWCWLGVAAAIAACQGSGTGTEAQGLSGDPSEPNCGFDVQEPDDEAVDPCLDGPGVVTLLGPETFERETGAPETVSAGFSVPESGVVCVRVSNDGVAAATIAIDGADVLTPEDFTPHVSTLTARPELGPGDHELSVTVASKPGSSLTVEIRFAPGAAPLDPTVGPEGLLAVAGLGDDPDPFSPADENGIRDETTFQIVGTAIDTPGGSSGQFEFLMRVTFEVAGGAECEAIVSLAAETVLLEGASSLAQAQWDGRDAAAALVGDGVYFYRATAVMVRRKLSDSSEEVLDTAVSPIQAVTVDNTGPVVTVLHPESGSTVAGTLTVTVAATDLGGIATLTAEVDTTSIADDVFDALQSTRAIDALLDTGTLSNGPHTITARGSDAAGNETEMSPVSFIVDNPATASITAIEPPSGTAGAFVTITGAGFDPGDLQVFVGGELATVVTATTSAIQIRLPEDELGVAGVSVVSGGSTVAPPAPFRCLSPRFTVAKPAPGQPSVPT